MDLYHKCGGDHTRGVCADGYGNGGWPRSSGERKVGMGNQIWVSSEDDGWLGSRATTSGFSDRMSSMGAHSGAGEYEREVVMGGVR
jgi:hypothetical protein